MPVRCGPVIFVHLDMQRLVNLGNIVHGGAGFEESPTWRCHTAHLDAPVQVCLRHLEILEHVFGCGAMSMVELSGRYPEESISYLVSTGLLLDDDDVEHEAWRLRANQISIVPWNPMAAVLTAQNRWIDVNLDDVKNSELSLSISTLISRFGPPPTEDYERVQAEQLVALNEPVGSDLLALLDARRSCREFAETESLGFAEFSAVMFGPWGATRISQVAPGFVIAHKGVPSGGGLHPIEAYVLARRIEGVRSGLYHYRAMHHKLSPLKFLTIDEVSSLAIRFLAGQRWAGDAAMIIIMTARVDRQFWKYRCHAKALKVLHMDAGHLSQTAYLIATDLALGAIVSAAINERNIEAELDLNPLNEIPVAAIAIGPKKANI